jgi:hypothetical protein
MITQIDNGRRMVFFALRQFGNDSEAPFKLTILVQKLTILVQKLTILVQKLGHNVLRASLFARSTAWFAFLLFSTSVALVPHEIDA